MQGLIYSKRKKQSIGMCLLYLGGIERSSFIGMERSFILNFSGREDNLFNQGQVKADMTCQANMF